jgi:hypothetical protein
MFTSFCELIMFTSVTRNSRWHTTTCLYDTCAVSICCSLGEKTRYDEHTFFNKSKTRCHNGTIVETQAMTSKVFKASPRRRLGDKASRKLGRPRRLNFSALFFFPFLFPISLLFNAFFQ